MSVLADGKVSFSGHALNRILEMTLEPEEVVNCLESPDDVRESAAHPGSWNYRHGRVTLGVNRYGDCLRVVTAVWSTQEDWVEDLARAGSDRVLKDHVANLRHRKG